MTSASPSSPVTTTGALAPNTAPSTAPALAPGSVRVAAIDCGTNSIRLLVADLDPAAGTLTDVTRLMEVVRLGQGVDKTGRLAPEALTKLRTGSNGLPQLASTCSSSRYLAKTGSRASITYRPSLSRCTNAKIGRAHV